MISKKLSTFLPRRHVLEAISDLSVAEGIVKMSKVGLKCSTDSWDRSKGKCTTVRCSRDFSVPSVHIEIKYRVTHLVANLGWVDLDLGCSTILLGQ